MKENKNFETLSPEKPIPRAAQLNSGSHPLLEKASQIQQEAWSVIEDTQVIKLWKDIGATVNLVGSLKTGLLIHNRDIDFHIYTHPFKLADSFSVISRLAESNRIKTIHYSNLLEAEDKCIEWHASYETQEGFTSTFVM